MADWRRTARPGSVEALDAGCTCPVLDNERGRGWAGDSHTYVLVESCPLHDSDRELGRLAAAAGDAEDVPGTDDERCA